MASIQYTHLQVILASAMYPLITGASAGPANGVTVNTATGTVRHTASNMSEIIPLKVAPACQLLEITK